MINWVDINVCYSKPEFVYNQSKVVDRLLEYFPNSHTERKDLLQIEVEKIWNYVMSHPPEKRPMIIYEQMKRRHDHEGPIFEAWIDFDKLRVRGLCSIYSVSFCSENEMPDDVVGTLIDFINSVTPEQYQDRIYLSWIEK